MDNKKIKVLIGDDSAEYGITCANELRSLGLYVVTRRKDGKVILDAIRNDTPDVVVMDAVLPGMDAIEILEKSQTFETDRLSSSHLLMKMRLSSVRSWKRVRRTSC